MCRIYGVFNDEIPPSELRTVAALQWHGGPDGRGSAQDRAWAIGSNRLAIMDPRGGRQPYKFLGGAIRVVFNGEIYNHRDLRRSLELRGYAFEDDCDGSILPALYHRHGDSFAEHLDGMYAIAVLDQRGEPRLVLATDHIGMKPIYYRWDQAAQKLYFASEIPALLAFAAVSRMAWRAGLDAYLATKTPFGEQTMFADVRALPPAATATFDRASGLRIRRRDLGDLPAHDADLARADLTDLADETRELLAQEVRRLQVADTAVASIISGGLDSGLVTALAAAGGEQVDAFNIAYKGTWPGDERRYARLIARCSGAVYHQVLADPETFPDLVADVVWHLGQPNADPITLSTYCLFGAVRNAGFKVALAGDVADEVFGGYGRMQAAASATGPGWPGAYLDALAVLPARRRRALYTRDYAAELAAPESAIPEAAVRSLRDGPGTPLQRVCELELRYRLPAYHLRRVDHLSMAHSVEVRLPFGQRRVVALACALPDHLKISGVAVKRTLHAVGRGLLPAEVLNRPKQPFTLPIAAMLAPGWPLWDFAHDVLASRDLSTEGQLDAGAVRQLFADQADRRDETTALTIWALMIYQVWREQFRSARPGRDRNEEVMIA
jgi:asparagine synthase (glutamine-hydrolysing)